MPLDAAVAVAFATNGPRRRCCCSARTSTPARYAQRLFADQPAGLGYLLKERVSDIAVPIDALRRVTEDECVLDPSIVATAHATTPLW